jgi:hypothetical protein
MDLEHVSMEACPIILRQVYNRLHPIRKAAEVPAAFVAKQFLFKPTYPALAVTRVGSARLLNLGSGMNRSTRMSNAETSVRAEVM